jgi:methylglutaconyl-CoA hydratase
MTSPCVTSTRAGAVAVLTIDRKERSNALSRETLTELGRLARAAIGDKAVRALVITGAGTQVFCAGADLKERATMDERAVREQLAAYREELGAIAHSNKPVVAAVNGAALGGGLELALACDLRVCAPHATFALPETSLAIIPGAGGTQRLPRVIGEGRAKEMILLGRRLVAPEALSWGLVNRIATSAETLIDEVIGYLEPVTSGAPIAQAAALTAIDAAFDLPLDEGFARETEAYEACLASADRRAALAAFAKKEKPTFRGR